LSSFALAQDIQLSFQHLSQEDGLSQSFNSFIFKDSYGFVWLSSLDGLNRYDGQQVKVYKHAEEDSTSVYDNTVNSSFFEDEQHNLWFASYNAINCYIRDQDHFRSFRLKNREGKEITEDYHAFHLDNDNQLWIRTGLNKKGELHLFNIQTFEDQILGPLNGHRLKVKTNDNGKVTQIISSMIPTIEGIEITTIDTQQNLSKQTYFQAPSKEQMHITSVAIHSDSLLWLCLPNGIGAFNPLNGKLKTYPHFKDTLIGKTWDIVPYKKDLLFVSSLRNGLLVFDKVSRTFIQQFTHVADVKESLSKQTIHELYIDDHENLWATIWSMGVDYTNLRKIKFKTLLKRKNNVRGQSFFAITADSSFNIWCGSNRGIFVFNTDKKLISRFHHSSQGAQKVPAKTVFFLDNIRNQEMWGTLGNTLYKFTLNPDKAEPIAAINGRIHHILKLRSGKILVASEGGLWQLNEKGGKVTMELAEGFEDSENRSFTLLYEDRQGSLYISENGEKVNLYTPNGSSFDLVKSITTVGYCKAIYEPPGDSTLWMASSKGLLLFNKKNLSLDLLNEKDGIPLGTYYSIIPDKKQHFWLSSNNGIVKYNPTQKTFRRYSVADGIQGYEFNTNAYYYQQESGEIWLGGNSGINVFNPEEIKDLPFTPDIQFTQININDEPDTIPVPQQEKTGLNLAYEQNTLSFDFVGMDYSDVNSVKFQYRMLGYDRNWVPETRRGFARYPNLPPGDYTFQVKAANSDGVWTPESKDLRIHIQTPFWQTWWFYLACLAVISAIIYGWFRYRLEQALKMERMRVKISSDLHDDVGTLLSGLAMQSELLELTATGEDKPRLKRIGEMSRNAMSRMRDTVWAIDARKDKFENLLDRMREHAEETLSAKDIHFTIKADSLNLKMNLPSHIRQNIYLIYKEAVTNVAKHSNADQVLITITQTGKAIEMKIHDNGQVQEKAYKTTGLGSENMQMRAEQLGGQLIINKEEGYEVTLSIAEIK